MDCERTREELIPCLANCVDALPDEPSFNLAEQLERLVPFVGGKDHVGILLDILVKLACEDEVIVRERAVESMKNICATLDLEQCEKSFFPLIENMISSDWFTTKCSAGCLIAVCKQYFFYHFENVFPDGVRKNVTGKTNRIAKFLPKFNSGRFTNGQTFNW